MGRQLEQRVAAFFATNGYATRCNEILEGRSGGRHEIDVLAEKSDALTTYRVAVECKAWQQPIEKDVVSKLHYVLSDLGLSKGIVVSGPVKPIEWPYCADVISRWSDGECPLKNGRRISRSNRCVNWRVPGRSRWWESEKKESSNHLRVSKMGT